MLAPLALLSALATPAGADGGGAAGLVEQEFENAIKTLSPATVFVAPSPKLGPSPGAGGSSGVMITRDGYVLSDGDTGLIRRPKTGPDGKFLRRPDGGPVIEDISSDEVEVRIPDLRRGTYAVFPGTVVKRIKGIDSSLVKITKPPASGFPFVVPGTSSRLEVGHFTFAMGTSFPSDSGDAASSLTAGVVAALAPQPETDASGKWAEVYTSAAVNPGVNGGPLVDADGMLVGIISSWGQPDPENPYQFLGKAFPIDRIRSGYADLPGFTSIFPDPKSIPTKSKQADRLERAFAATAKKVAPSVVSLEVSRPEPVKTKIPARTPPNQPPPRKPVMVEIPRYQGPTSGLVVSRDGWIVASLYSFADVYPIAEFRTGLKNRVSRCLAGLSGVTAHFADGTRAPAKVVSHDERLGVVCLKATLPAGYDAVPLEIAPAGSLQIGRLVLCVARPFGAAARTWPLLTVGIVSKVHSPDTPHPWAGDFQTDAGLTDGTAGAALVDVRGRLLGLSTLWMPTDQGRNSGIGYGVPWARIEAALPTMRGGTCATVGTGMIDVAFDEPESRRPASPLAKIRFVGANGPAAKAGIAVGDVIVSVDGHPITERFDAMFFLRQRMPGDHTKVRVDRGGKLLDFDVVVGERPAETDAADDAEPETPTPAPTPGMDEPKKEPAPPAEEPKPPPDEGAKPPPDDGVKPPSSPGGAGH